MNWAWFIKRNKNMFYLLHKWSSKTNRKYVLNSESHIIAIITINIVWNIDLSFIISWDWAAAPYLSTHFLWKGYYDNCRDISSRSCPLLDKGKTTQLQSECFDFTDRWSNLYGVEIISVKQLNVSNFEKYLPVCVQINWIHRSRCATQATVNNWQGRNWKLFKCGSQIS